MGNCWMPISMDASKSRMLGWKAQRTNACYCCLPHNGHKSFQKRQKKTRYDCRSLWAINVLKMACFGLPDTGNYMRTHANPRKFWSPTWPEINLVLGLAQFLHIIACVEEAKNMPLLEHLLHIVNLSSYLVFLCSDVSLLFFFDTTQKKISWKKELLIQM